ncbi:MAG: response regulator [bacterium]|nr:response regulator [bacterium]MDE0668081.1 response regulator [bacterium]MXZ31784.1 response regulator [Acidimicrobiia bacterium]MYB24268.1 response regulator [Acidimicrobiia bacterium]MYJ13622.1 response regulator [Acidimicrobiia bacterium]
MSAERPVGARTRVVVAEDEAIIRLDLKETLTTEGYEVVADTGRGDQALALVQELRPDVAILDIKMPGNDGLAVARAITDERLCAVLVLTAFSQRELVAQAAQAGVLAYLVKPFAAGELVAAIEIALARFGEAQALAAEAADFAEQLETRKIVERAKGLLTDNYGFREGDAFAFMRRTAMNQRRPMRAVAEDLLAGTLSVASKPADGRP